MLIDTHAHIYDEVFVTDIEEVMNRANTVGVEKIVLPNIDRNSLGDMLKLTLRYPDRLYPAIGLHPSDVKANWKEELQWLKEHFYLYKYVAIGEIGLDYYWTKEFMEEQKEAFREQLRWAVEEKLPVIIHTRKAFDDTFSIISEIEKEKNTKIRGVFHSFSASIEQLKQALKFEEFMIGIGGVVTFKNAKLKEIIPSIPLDRLVFETDAPYLSPEPYRGKRNEPSYIKNTANFVASILSKDINEIEEITTNNAKKLFSL